MAEQFDSKVIADRYEIQNTLGKGGMGVVLLCLDLVLARKVAVKVLSKNSDDETVKRFQIEARAAAKLKHDNILQVMDFGETNGRLFLVMDYLEGITLSSLIKQESYLAPEVAIPIFMQISSGLAHAHGRDILHRDIKPTNIMLIPESSSQWKVKIVDFGIAKLKTVTDQKLTTTGAVIGSPLYLSPEAGLGQPCDKRSDIYSLGCLMFETLTGSVPFHGDTAFSTILMHTEEIAPTMSERTNRHYDEALEDLIAKCLQKDPDDRYDAVDQLNYDLSRILAGARPPKTDDGEPMNKLESSAPAQPKDKRSIFFMLIILVAALYIAVPLMQTLVQSSDAVSQSEDPAKFFPRFKVKPSMGMVGTNLEPFKFDGTHVKGREDFVTDKHLLSYAPKYKSATSWDLQKTLIDGPGLRALPKTTSHLEIGNTPIGGEAVKHISKLKNLTYLDIRDCENITPKDLRELSNLSELRTIQITLPENKSDSADKISALSTLPNLTSLMIDGYTTLESIRNLKKLDKLAYLNFYPMCEQCDPVDLGNALSDLPKLKKIHMTESGLDPRTVITIAKHDTLSQLDVVLPQNRKEADELVLAIAQLKHLQFLSIRGMLDPVMIKAIGAMPELKQFSYSKNRQSSADIKDLNQMTPRIKQNPNYQ